MPSEKSVDNPTDTPAVTLPQGGGSIRSLSDNIAINAFTGSFQYNIPLPFPAARELSPSLSLDYSSGSGNDVFGCGFSMEQQCIARLTRFGIPRYDDTDIFTLNDNELVLKQGETDIYLERRQLIFPYIRMYAGGTAGCYWETVSVDNSMSKYGSTPESRIYDPADNTRIYKWLLTEETDSKGNRIKYNYTKFNSTNAYLSSVEYGNYSDSDGNDTFAFEIILDYGNHNLKNLHQPHADPYHSQGNPPRRADILHSFMSSFEIATEYLCRHILIFHNFKELGTGPCLTRFLTFEYDENPVMSTLAAVEETGCIRKADMSYSTLSIPKTDFIFTKFNPDTNPTYKLVAASNSDLQVPLNLIDLEGEGIAGIVYQQADSFLYYQPQGDGHFIQSDPFQVPAGSTETGNRMFLASVNGDGTLQLVSDTTTEKGYYTIMKDNKWENFTPFPSSFITDIPGYMEQADISGTGKNDKIILESKEKVYIPSLGYDGYGKPVNLTGHNQVFPYPGSLADIDPFTIHSFADMFGDGLLHRVKITSGEVSIWPTLGYGRFASPVIITDSAPVFTQDMDLRTRLLLADVDGSGTTDLVIIYPTYVDIYINQSGNSFSSPVRIYLPAGEVYSNADKIQFADMTGHGTMCLVFTKTGTPVKHFYCELTDINKKNNQADKAFLLSGINNNIGTYLSVEYSSSVTDYLEDRNTAGAWYTKLPFPVQVVRQTTTEDSISNNKLVTRYRYRNGFYDPYERTFTGFAYVEYTDTAIDLIPGGNNPPATVTKKWFHIGTGLQEEPTRREFYSGDNKAPVIPFAQYDFDFKTASDLTKEQALYALTGNELHTEMFKMATAVPYTVSSSCYFVKNPQLCSEKRYGVFSVYRNENASLNYEQDPGDPMLAQFAILDADDYNHPLLTCAINYPRRTPLLPEQYVFYAMANKLVVKNQDNPHARWIGIEEKEMSFEITGLKLSTGDNYIPFTALQASIPGSVAQAIPYSQKPGLNSICARMISWKNEFYWDAVQKNPLGPTDPFPSTLLPHHSESIDFDNTIITTAFNSERVRLTDEFIRSKGFVFQNNYWWNRSVVTHFEKADKFFLQKMISNDWAKEAGVDPSLYTETSISYDPYHLFVIKTSQRLNDSVSQVEHAEMDYRVLQARKIVDMNNNTAEVQFDELERVIVSTSYGKENGQPVGFEPLSGYAYQLPPDAHAVLQNPLSYLGKAEAFYYYRFAGKKPGGEWEPSLQVTLLATRFQSNDPATIQRTVTYIDGFGRNIETKQWAGKVKLPDNTETDNGYLASGRTIYNAKGLVYQSYLPVFAGSYTYESNWQTDIAPLLPPPTVYQYDALNRVTRTDTPKGFFTKTEYGAWDQKSYDEDDTVVESPYYKQFMRSHNSGDEYDSLVRAAAFYNTPATVLLDAMGRTVITMQDNLGRVLPALFKNIATPGITAQAIYDDLLAKGYLVSATDSDGGAWITGKFTPFIKGFTLQLDTPVSSLASSIQTLLQPSCLCTWKQYDITNRVICTADPRFFMENLANAVPRYNFINLFNITGNSPLLVTSLDADNNRVFSDMLNNTVQSWNALDFHTKNTYDNLQRLLTVYVDSPAGFKTPINQIVQRFEYGDTLPDPSQNQLMGKVYKVYDSAGTLDNPAYTYTGLLKQQVRKFRTGYKVEANWNTINSEPLENASFPSSREYDALGRPVLQTHPDNSVIKWEYGPLDNCTQSSIRYKGQGDWKTILAENDVNANLQPASFLYGNGTKTFFEYDAATLLLTKIKSTRNAGNDCFQQLLYTNDPTGLITTIRNTQQATVFNNNNEINPCSQYHYDAIYRLKKMIGRQLQGVTAHVTPVMKKNGVHKKPPVTDLQQVELYSEYYNYDDGNNITGLQHVATGSSVTKTFKISPTSNRLEKYDDTTVSYDNAGQMQALPAGAKLEWNFRGNIQYAKIIERDNGMSDGEYYVYNYAGTRVRKVHEALAQNETYRVTDKRYIDNYTVWYTGTQPNSAPAMNADKEFRSICCSGISQNDCLVQYREKNGTKKEVTALLFRYQHSDLLQSVTIETNETAEIISLEEYSPFGDTTYWWEATNLEVGRKEFRYSAREKDDHTGLYYYGYRYYLPQLCRWTRPDPGGTVDGLNLYAFVGNDPVRNRDIMGLGKILEKESKDKKPKGGVGKKEKRSTVKRRGISVTKYSTQKDLTGKTQKRKSFFPVGVEDSDRRNYVQKTRQVTAILKIDGEEVLSGHNSSLDKSLQVPVGVGMENQDGCKCNFHAEDLTLGSFIHHVQEHYDGLQDYHDHNPHDFAHNADGMHVFSLKISASPCLGCVETIVSFKKDLEAALGEDGFIFRVKFARLYKLASTSTDPDSDSAVNFRTAIGTLRSEGIGVRLQTRESLADMMEIDEEDLPEGVRTDIEGTLEMFEGEEDIEMLQWSWPEQGFSRKTSNWN
ncbi:MAG: SpvB/TcaC N-terminal domain-containing protein [Bacteroidota bacterium]|nr:SpvB/TcaC N-terminal domain-containing protein [Bacteroidota bacterium]